MSTFDVSCTPEGQECAESAMALNSAIEADLSAILYALVAGINEHESSNAATLKKLQQFIKRRLDADNGKSLTALQAVVNYLGQSVYDSLQDTQYHINSLGTVGLTASVTPQNGNAGDVIPGVSAGDSTTSFTSAGGPEPPSETQPVRPQAVIDTTNVANAVAAGIAVATSDAVATGGSIGPVSVSVIKDIEGVPRIEIHLSVTVLPAPVQIIYRGRRIKPPATDAFAQGPPVGGVAAQSFNPEMYGDAPEDDEGDLLLQEELHPKRGVGDEPEDVYVEDDEGL